MPLLQPVRRAQPLALLPLDLFTGDAPIVVDPVYAKADHPDNIFKNLYHPNARLFAHARLVPVILRAAQLLHERTGWHLKINDCFRPIEAQQRMAGYHLPPELVLAPGCGGHPRGMAVDVQPVMADGTLVDMGTPFDFFTDDLNMNPAARYARNHSETILNNRRQLDRAMFDAAKACGEALIGFPEEWWDYRFPACVYEAYEPGVESALPAAYHMVGAPAQPDAALAAAWQAQRQQILAKF